MLQNVTWLAIVAVHAAENELSEVWGAANGRGRPKEIFLPRADEGDHGGLAEHLLPVRPCVAMNFVHHLVIT